MSKRTGKKAYLFGHTGSFNRGCEAIVRSTSMILKDVGFEDVYLKIHNPDFDKKLKVDECVRFVPYAAHGFAMKAVCAVAWRYFKCLIPEVFRAGADLKLSREEAVLFNIGGDTYCYNFPYKLVAQNRAIQKKCLTNIFWGCSVDERILADRRLTEDMNRYDFIVARESLSYEMLKRTVTDPDKLFLACDPAFHLPMVETPLPEHFKPGKTVGINLSPLFFRDYTDSRDIMRRNVKALIDYIIHNTDMNVCLVPHVYDGENNREDVDVLGCIASEYSGSDRLCLVRTDLSCGQLKYIISQCRLFVGARTHSMIAAYSTGVPALALSYSIKSKGIARDLYGDEELVVKRDVAGEDELLNAFLRLMEREDELRKRYDQVLDAYKQSIYDVACSIVHKISDQ